MIDFVTDAATVVSLSIFSESRVARAENASFVVVTSPPRSLFSSALDGESCLCCISQGEKEAFKELWVVFVCLFSVYLKIAT